MIKRHWANIRTCFTHRITNAGAEALNAEIQSAKRRACGFRNRARFSTSIFLHCGGLDFYPARGQAHDSSHTILGSPSICIAP